MEIGCVAYYVIEILSNNIIGFKRKSVKPLPRATKTNDDGWVCGEVRLEYIACKPYTLG